jgi:hypothetical protein
LSLRTLLCMIVYTQSCSMLSTCYSFVSMAVAATFRTGMLDLSDHGGSAQYKACLTATLRVLFIVDTSVASSLGLPRTLRDIDTELLIRSSTSDSARFDNDTAAHSQLMKILADIVETNHPPCKRIPRHNGFYSVRYSDIVQAENRLAVWFKCLDDSFTVGSPHNGDKDFIRYVLGRTTFDHMDMLTMPRTQLLLRTYHAQVQISLHHLLKPSPANDELGKKAYACGDACIKAATQIVRLVEKMEANDVFNTAHWYLNLIIAHTAACLVLFTISGTHSPMVHETELAIRGLKDICMRNADRENSIKQCLSFLEV